jgi:hypothetical protein
MRLCLQETMDLYKQIYIVVFWVMIPLVSYVVTVCFGGTCCLHLHCSIVGGYQVTQETTTSIFRVEDYLPYDSVY